MRALPTLLLLAMFAPAPRLAAAASADETHGLRPAAFRYDALSEDEIAAFLRALQAAVRSDDPAAVSRLVTYPLRVNRPTAKTRVASASEFVRNYSIIFTSEIRSAVLAQEYDKLFRNWQGFMVGTGEVWFAGSCPDQNCSRHRVGVITVNLPK